MSLNPESLATMTEHVITERKASRVVLMRPVSIDGVHSDRFNAEDGFILYSCGDDGKLFCVTIRRSDSPTAVFYADDVQAVVML